MINIHAWMEKFLRALQGTFANRVWFVGLQGSYGRGEATDTSDIDVVVILDDLSFKDVQSYEAMLNTLPHRELICGFLSGKEELLNWESSDLFRFCHDTTPIKGSLDKVLAMVDKGAVDRAVKTGVCNIYHGCVHNMLHEKSEEILRGLYKSASFVVQAIVYRQRGSYIKQQNDLQLLASPNDKQIIDTFAHLKNGGQPDFCEMSEALFTWCRKQIANK